MALRRGGWGGGGGGGGRKTVAPKIPRVVCLSHPCTFRHSSEGRQIRPAELRVSNLSFRALDELSG